MIRILVAVVALALAPSSASALEVVTTTEGLASIVREVGGPAVKVEALSRGTQDPHFVDANPVLAVKLRRADLLVDTGLDLEVGWLPPLVNQARNAALQPGQKGRLTAASAVQVLEAPTGAVDRSMGDLHPAGNPHFMSDPRRVGAVAAAVAARLAELDPQGAATYQAGLAAFRKRLDEEERRWRAALAPFAGRKVVTHHDSLPYFLEWAGLAAAGYLEPKPGTPPPPSHLASLVQVVKAQNVRAVLVEAYHDRRSADIVARHGGAKVVAIPGDVGGLRDEGGAIEPKDWFAYVGALVDLVTGALR